MLDKEDHLFWSNTLSVEAGRQDVQFQLIW